MLKRKLRQHDPCDVQDRTDTGKFARNCGCLMHQTWSYTSTYEVLHTEKSKRFTKAVIDNMRQQSYLGKYGKLLCTACYEHFKG